jgi:hypothetical protein
MKQKNEHKKKRLAILTLIVFLFFSISFMPQLGAWSPSNPSWASGLSSNTTQCYTYYEVGFTIALYDNTSKISYIEIWGNNTLCPINGYYTSPPSGFTANTNQTRYDSSGNYWLYICQRVLMSDGVTHKYNCIKVLLCPKNFDVYSPVKNRSLLDNLCYQSGGAHKDAVAYALANKRYIWVNAIHEVKRYSTDTIHGLNSNGTWGNGAIFIDKANQYINKTTIQNLPWNHNEVRGQIEKYYNIYVQLKDQNGGVVDNVDPTCTGSLGSYADATPKYTETENGGTIKTYWYVSGQRVQWIVNADDNVAIRYMWVQLRSGDEIIRQMYNRQTKTVDISKGSYTPDSNYSSNSHMMYRTNSSGDITSFCTYLDTSCAATPQIHGYFYPLEGEEEYKLEVMAQDYQANNAGRSYNYNNAAPYFMQWTNYWVKVDDTAPTIDAPVIQNIGQTTFDGNTSSPYEVDIKVEDTRSGVKSASYIIVDANTYPTIDDIPADTENWTAFTNVSTSGTKVTTSSMIDTITEYGELAIYIRATDNCDNATIERYDGYGLANPPEIDIEATENTDIFLSCQVYTQTSGASDVVLYDTTSINAGEPVLSDYAGLPNESDERNYVEYATPSYVEGGNNTYQIKLTSRDGEVYFKHDENEFPELSDVFSPIAFINLTIVPLEEENPPPDPEWGDEYDGFTVPALPSLVSNTTVEWNDWLYNGSTWVNNEYNVSSNGEITIYPDEHCPTGTLEAMGSMYGISPVIESNLVTSNNITATNINNLIIYNENQSAFIYFPEEDWNRSRECEITNDVDLKDVSYELGITDYAFFQNRVNFIALDYPDGDYPVYCYVRNIWTPAGEIYFRDDDVIEIDGTAINDWRIYSYRE